MSTTGNDTPNASDAPATIPGLDGIRALAVALVFFAHSGLESVIPGGLGVTVFFVLSGFLITTLMRQEHARTGRLDFRGFYLRRLLRLMPPLVVVIMIAAALAALGVIDGAFTPGGFAAALFYLGNYFVIAQDFHGLPAGLGVIWSLAIEEHFYLFYPPLALLLLRARSTGGAALVLAGLCVAVLAWRVWLVRQGMSVEYLTMATDTRVDAILVGCLLALWRNPWLAPQPMHSAPGRVLRERVVVGLCLATLLLTFVWRDEAFRQTARYTLQSLAIAGLLHAAVARAGSRPWRWLNARPLVYLGSISYTVYLSHHVILLGLAKHAPQWGWVGLTVGGALLTLAVAEPMRRWVEAPCAALRRRLHRERLARQAPPALHLVGTP